VKIIALSMHSGKKFVVEMLKAGACGYLLKDCAADELTNAIKSVIESNNYLSPAITDVVIENYVRGDSKAGESAFSVLTQREREVLQLLAEGNTTKQIALQLYISPKTVEAHRLRIMKKLDIDNIAKLTKYAIQEGLTSPEP
jgi:DNA-binding NarL/FixJ family response regulator